MRADLHCHTRVSDGSMTPEDLVDYAARIGLDCLAVTDHDSMAGVEAARERAEIYGVKLIPGLEVSAYDFQNHKKVHLLCYGPRRPKPLLELCAETLRARSEASVRIIRMVAARYPLDLKTVQKYAAGSGAIYKQHIVKALAEMGYTLSVFGDLFRELFSARGGWARVEVRYPDCREALEVMRQTGGLCVLAHPGVYGNFDIIDELCGIGLDGIECCHPRQSEADEQAAFEAAKKHGLLATGGSDFHGMFSARVNPLAARTAPESILPLFLDKIAAGQ